MKSLRKILINLNSVFNTLFFDIFGLINKWRGLPYFIKNYIAYKKKFNGNKFSINIKNIYPILNERFSAAGGTKGHYFLQDIWAAREIFKNNIKNHVDVGSRVDGFVANLLSFTKVTYLDIREIDVNLDGLTYKYGSITNLPYIDNSIVSLSCLHVIEHIGLGRYGDSIDIDGYSKACSELERVLANDGLLLIGVPVGKEKLCFDAHRIFDPQTIINSFDKLKLIEFSLIDDHGIDIKHHASFEMARNCDYGCGLFIFKKLACS